MSTFREKVFSGAPVKCSSDFGSNISDCFVFGNAAFGEIKDHSLRATLFQEKKIYGSFEIVCIFCENVFCLAPVKHFSLYSSNNFFLVFGNTAFEEIKDHSLRTTRFQKKNCYGSFRYVSLLRIKVFSGSIFNEVLFSLWLIQLRFFLVFRNAAFGEFNHHSLKRIPFQKKNCY